MSSASLLESRPEGVVILDDRLVLKMSDGSEVNASFSDFPRLRDASMSQRKHWEWVGARSGIHWPEIDEDLSVHGILRRDEIRRDAMRRVPFLVADLMRMTEELNRLFPGRRFTPDGHLIGSIGEVVAEYIYGLRLEVCSNPAFDARTEDGRTVQIKLTGPTGRSYGIRWSSQRTTITPDILLGMKLEQRGFREIYNGPFPVELLEAKRDTTNGQVSVSLTSLSSRNPSLLPQVRSLEEFNHLFHFELDSAA